jgi:transcriptional regulator GlxA family with amidase domain
MTPRRIGLLGFDGIQALDLVGPADAFGSDALAPPAAGPTAPYEIVVIGLTGRRFKTSCGVVMQADVLADARLRLDTLIVPGGAGLRRPGVAERAAEWIVARAPRVRRIASVCTGLYALAPTGLVDGARVTTHWSAVADIARRFPKLRVDPDAIYVRAGKIYTSAGITAGIDLSLALIEDDLGPEAALAVAREMVVYYKRTGGQKQFSDALQFQISASDRFKELGAWIHSHLRDDLSVETLAARTYLSVRQFARAFRDEFKTTPAAFVEEARMAEASRRLSASSRRVSIEAVARSVGYSSDDVFRRAFQRRFGVSPVAYRNHFSAGAAS